MTNRIPDEVQSRQSRLATTDQLCDQKKVPLALLWSFSSLERDTALVLRIRIFIVRPLFLPVNEEDLSSFESFCVSFVAVRSGRVDLLYHVTVTLRSVFFFSRER